MADMESSFVTSIEGLASVYAPPAERIVKATRAMSALPPIADISWRIGMVAAAQRTRSDFSAAYHFRGIGR